MQISEKRLDEYLQLYFEINSKEISRAKALEDFTALITYMEAVNRYNNFERPKISVLEYNKKTK